MGTVIDNSPLDKQQQQTTTDTNGAATQTTTDTNGAATQTTTDTSGASTQTTNEADVTGTQGTGAPVGAAVQTTDAEQAAGGQDNAGVKPPEQTITGLPQFQLKYNPPGADGKPVAPTLVVTPGQTPPAASPSDIPEPQSTDGSNNDVAQSVVENKSGQFTMNHNVDGQYLADWANNPFMDVVKSGDKSIADYILDYNKWAQANGKDPLDVLTMYQAMQNKDIAKSYGQNEKEDKKLQRQQRWEQIGNVLSHLGNFVGTIAGAPSQTIETGPQLTARQQAVRDAITKQRGDPKNILAQIWKQRADQRAKELNDANVALRAAQKATEGARKANVEGKTANEKAQSDANVALKGAQQGQAESATQENNAQTSYINGKNKREKELQPYKKSVLTSQTRRNNAGADASEASAARSAAQTRAANEQTYGKRYQRNRYKIWARNRRLHPNETQQFMKEMNITGYDKKSWTPTVVDEYNAYVTEKVSSSRRGRGGASSLLD